MKQIEYHGISSGLLHMGGSGWVKREILLYDKVGLTYLGACKDMLRGYSPVKARRADDYEYLEDRGVLYEAEIPLASENKDVVESLRLATEANERFEYEHPSDPGKYYERERSGRKPAPDAIRHHYDTQAFICRATAVDASQRDGVIATPMLGATSLVEAVPASKRAVVVQAVLHQFPVPGELTSFDDLLQLRAEEEFRLKRNALRAWVRGAASKGWSTNECQEEIAYLLEQYRQYMRVQKLKYSLSSLSAVAKFSAGLVEDAAKLKLKDVVGAVCSVFTTNVNLTEAELKAPGRELAYIDALGERLGPGAAD